MPNTCLRESGLCDLTAAEANVVGLQGSDATHLSASWLILVVAGFASWAAAKSV